MSYDVRITHDSVRWNVSGALARGYVRDSTIFFCGRAMFIAAVGRDSLPIRVETRLPAGWSIAIAPWSGVRREARSS